MLSQMHDQPFMSQVRYNSSMKNAAFIKSVALTTCDMADELEVRGRLIMFAFFIPQTLCSSLTMPTDLSGVLPSILNSVAWLMTLLSTK